MYTKGDSLFPAPAGFEVLPLRTVLQLLVPDVLPFSSPVPLFGAFIGELVRGIAVALCLDF
jgi:hypothetical protein